jgi:hypothetical protein
MLNHDVEYTIKVVIKIKMIMVKYHTLHLALPLTLCIWKSSRSANLQSCIVMCIFRGIDWMKISWMGGLTINLKYTVIY